MVTKTYTSATKLLEDTWKYATKKQKLDLLKSRDLDSSWAVTKTIKEMVRRGGGFVASSLLKLQRIYLEKEGGRVTINW